MRAGERCSSVHAVDYLHVYGGVHYAFTVENDSIVGRLLVKLHGAYIYAGAAKLAALATHVLHRDVGGGEAVHTGAEGLQAEPNLISRLGWQWWLSDR